MTRTIRDKTKPQARVWRIQGQAAALERQPAEGGDRTIILQQTAATRGTVNRLVAVVVEGHPTDHVVKELAETWCRQDLDAMM